MCLSWRGKIVKSQRQRKAMREQRVLDTAGKLHLQTHDGCDVMQKTWTVQATSSPIMGVSPTASWRERVGRLSL